MNPYNPKVAMNNFVDKLNKRNKFQEKIKKKKNNEKKKFNQFVKE